MIQIAFAGHNRPDDLGHREQASAALAATFALIKATGVGEARLLSGLASGADELAAAAWREAGLGPVHAVLPFLDDPDVSKVGPGGLADSVTLLDGAAAEAQGRNPHLKQTRLIVEAADLVVVVWTGGPAKGAGGTADAVLCALEVGLPVLWIKPMEPHPIRLIRPERLPADFHFPEFQELLERGGLDHVEIATEDSLRELLTPAAATPAPPREPVAGWKAELDEFLHRSLWRTYATFRSLLGGRVDMSAPDVPVPASLAAQPGFVLLSEVYLRADRIANRLSAIHRSELVLLVLAMITAALVGSAPAVWPEFKVTAVCIELALSALGLLVWATARDARQHERWSEQRFLAEQIRLARAGWVIGVGGATPGAVKLDNRPGREAARLAGLPNGPFDAERVRSWGAWAMNELVQGQAAYHHAISIREARIAHRIHIVEDVSLLFLFVVFALYVTVHAFGFGHDLPHWISGAVSMTGTVVPAVAAASIALEAKLEFQEHSARSRRIANTLDSLAKRLGPAPSYSALQDVGRAAVNVHLAESSHWRDGTDRRRLFRL
ncbi:hypothetical protein [Phenylobacterium sp.]|uniref:hypothetical protein n=1 Tax=Phenylobacterium sp. TaxID=1871053 RepID=UPI002735ADA3|nr:hypothetical protein [Phenylobacterium sp.]MDP3660683.1 hypothetical protein [Phenylobacterium sp.]